MGNIVPITIIIITVLHHLLHPRTAAIPDSTAEITINIRGITIKIKAITINIKYQLVRLHLRHLLLQLLPLHQFVQWVRPHQGVRVVPEEERAREPTATLRPSVRPMPTLRQGDSVWHWA